MNLLRWAVLTLLAIDFLIMVLVGIIVYLYSSEEPFRLLWTLKAIIWWTGGQFLILWWIVRWAWAANREMEKGINSIKVMEDP